MWFVPASSNRLRIFQLWTRRMADGNGSQLHLWATKGEPCGLLSHENGMRSDVWLAENNRRQLHAVWETSLRQSGEFIEIPLQLGWPNKCESYRWVLHSGWGWTTGGRMSLCIHRQVLSVAVEIAIDTRTSRWTKNIDVKQCEWCARPAEYCQSVGCHSMQNQSFVETDSTEIVLWWLFGDGWFTIFRPPVDLFLITSDFSISCSFAVDECQSNSFR